MKKRDILNTLEKGMKYYQSQTIEKQTLLSFLLYVFSSLLSNIFLDIPLLGTLIHIFVLIVGLIFFINFTILIFQFLKKTSKSKYGLHTLTSVFAISIILIYQYNFSDEAKANKMREKAERIVKSKLDSLHYMNTNYMSSNNHFKYCDIKGSKFNANHDIEVYFDCLYDKGHYLVNGVTFDLMSSYVQDKKK